jgi:hypothetical protein
MRNCYPSTDTLNIIMLNTKLSVYKKKDGKLIYELKSLENNSKTYKLNFNLYNVFDIVIQENLLQVHQLL